MAFVPPHPPRPIRPLGPLEMLRRGRRNLLALWSDEAFDRELMWVRVLARWVWVCNSPDTVRQAFIGAGETFERKSPQMRHALKPLLGDGLFISDGATWRLRRKLVTPVVHTVHLPHFAPIMVEAALEARTRWNGLQRMDALEEMARLTAEIICRALFGRALGHERAGEIVSAFSDYQASVSQMDLAYLIGLPDWWPRLQGPGTLRSARRIRRTLDDVIEAYVRERDQDRSALIAGLLDARDDAGLPLSRAAVRNEIATLFMAGHETTANTLAWAWYLISQAPEVEAALHSEIDTVLAGRAPTLADVPALTYTRAVVEETLRLYPPVPILAREAQAGEMLRGRKVAAGSLVIVAPWLLHRHRKYWREPDAFRPERFLPGAEPYDRYVYVPFSIGPRVCAGLSFGLTEAVLCLAALAQSHRLRLVPGTEVKPVCRLTLRPDGGLPMTVEPRGGR